MSLVAVALLAIATFILIPGEKTVFAGKKPANIGIVSGKLAACPASPNCVSSFSQDAEHQIEPLAYTSSPAEAVAKLKGAIDSFGKTKKIGRAHV